MRLTAGPCVAPFQADRGRRDVGDGRGVHPHPGGESLRPTRAAAPRYGRAGQGRAGQGRAGQGRAGQGRAGKTWQGRAGQGRAGQGRGRVSQWLSRVKQSIWSPRT